MYEQSRKIILGSSEVDAQVLKRNYRFNLVF